MFFTRAAKITAYLIVLFGAFCVYQGVRITLEIGVVGQSNGLPVGPKVPLLSQGLVIICAGFVLGVLSEISYAVRRLIPKSTTKD